ncbi:hypothetical protein N752_22975 [Desulforamulus aquiferis]|nr:hypothetical protein N752_22975 [Desulforamulus aquiferis]
MQYIKKLSNHYDIVIIDCTDPSGPSLELFSKEFYQDVFDALKADGILVSQTGSPIFSPHFRQALKNLQEVFPRTRPYLTCDPTYFAGYWSFTIGSKEYGLENIINDRFSSLNTLFYTPEVHKAAFVIPRYIQNIID